MEGPNRIISAENLTTTKPDGSVKIREPDQKSNEYIEPMSLVTFLTQQVRAEMALSRNLNFSKKQHQLDDVMCRWAALL